MIDEHTPGKIAMNLLKPFIISTFVLIQTLTAHSATVIETVTTWNGGSTIAPVGEGTFETWGQTFTVPATDTLLDRFTMFLNDQIPFRPDFVEFAMYVMDWNVDRAAGPILYQSAMVATTNQPGLETFVFNTGGVPLVAGEDYVAIFSQSDFVDGSQGQGMVGSQFDIDAYPGHSFFRLDNDGDFSQVTTMPWANPFGGGATDMAFEAVFSAVPEPGSLALLGVGGMALLLQRRKGASLCVDQR